MNLIPERMKVLRRADHEVIWFNEKRAQEESLRAWGRTPAGELRPDDTPPVRSSSLISVGAIIP